MILLTDAHPGKGFVSSWEVLEQTGLFSHAMFYVPPRSRIGGVMNTARLALRIRQLNPERMFYLGQVGRSNWQLRRDRIFFQRICGISRIHGIEERDWESNLDRRGRNWGDLPSEACRLLDILRRSDLGITSQEPVRFDLPIGETEKMKVDFLYRKSCLPLDARIVAIGPGSKMPAKRWPVERFALVSKRLLGAFPDIHQIVLGGHDDYALGEVIRRFGGARVVNWAGRLSVLESAEVLRRCLLFIGNDTGTMHLAAAVNTQCAVIFSARDKPGRWYPHGDHHLVFRREVACAGCMLEVCKKNRMRCVRGISAEEVFRGAKSILAAGCAG
jgi:ADP-heptose:LPS heptosyltransferase